MGANEKTMEKSVSAAPSAPDNGEPGEAADLIEEESLVEEVSIDGMCGVY